jgi:DNA-binding beta-propeller fold protein YncE
MRRGLFCLMIGGLLMASTPVFGDGDGDKDFPVVPHLFSTSNVHASTVPSNGDLNPYGVAFVPKGFPEGGILRPGDVLVSNFNDSSNAQGTGTTIVKISPAGHTKLYFQGPPPPGLGLSTALGVLEKGFVIVGSVPSEDGLGACTEVNGMQTDVGQGSLMILNRHGKIVKTLTSERLLNGPWDLTVRDDGESASVFVSNVLSGTVTRLDLKVSDDDVSVERETQIASGYAHRCDPAAFVVGPTGLALDSATDTLYVASTADNRIFAIRDASERQGDAGTGQVFIDDSAHLHGPLGLARAPNGDLITAQSDAVNADPNHQSEIVEYNRRGDFIAEFSVEPNIPGSAFGIAIVPFDDGFRFAAVDDGINFLNIWDVR